MKNEERKNESDVKSAPQKKIKSEWKEAEIEKRKGLPLYVNNQRRRRDHSQTSALPLPGTGTSFWKRVVVQRSPARVKIVATRQVWAAVESYRRADTAT